MTWTGGLRNSDGTPQSVNGSSEWDYVVFAGDVCPGVAKVTARVPSAWDKQKAKGKKRARMVDNGDQLIEFTIDLTLQPSDFEAFRDFIIPVLRPPSKTGGRAPMTFEHPLAQMWKVNLVTIGDIETPTPGAGGTMSVQIKATEWVKDGANVQKSDKVQTSSGRSAGTVPGTTEVVQRDQFGSPYSTLSSLPSAGEQFE